MFYFTDKGLIPFNPETVSGVPNPLHSDNLQTAKSAFRDAYEASVVKAGQLPPRINCLSEASFVSGGIKAVLPQQETQCDPETDLPSAYPGSVIYFFRGTAVYVLLHW